MIMDRINQVDWEEMGSLRFQILAEARGQLHIKFSGR